MTKKKILIIGLIISVIIGIFSIKTGGKKNTIDTGIAATSNVQADLGKDFMSALFGVQNVSLDASLIKSPVFKSLVPSGAFVDANPNKGKDDPFSSLNNNLLGADTNTSDDFNQSLRSFDLGQTETTAINSADIKITKITSNSASISILGMPAGVVPVVNVTSKFSAVSFADFTYKNASGEYSAQINGLKPGNSYTITIISPTGYISTPVTFDVK